MEVDGANISNIFPLISPVEEGIEATPMLSNHISTLG